MKRRRRRGRECGGGGNGLSELRVNIRKSLYLNLDH
jgi:hypothetical protein